MLDSDTYLQPSDGADCQLIEIGPEKYILNANSFGSNSVRGFGVWDFWSVRSFIVRFW